jgi:uncharacterized protein involved in exopolysaccharide biosynthesis
MPAAFFQRLSLARWFSIAFVVFALTMLYGAYHTYLILPKIYVARAQIQVLSRGPDGRDGTESDRTSLRSDLEIMRSADVLLPVIKDLDLDKRWAKRVYKSGLDALPAQYALAYMGKVLRLDIRPGTNIIDINVSSTVPKEAADVANAIADRYEVMREAEKDQVNKRSEDALRDQIAAQQKVVDEKKAAMEDLRVELGQKGIQVSPGAGGLIEADLDARRKDLAAKGGQENANALEPFRDIQHQFDQQQGVLDELNVRLKQVMTDNHLQESPVRIISRAEPPEYPSLPDNALNLAFSALVGIVLALVLPTLVEVAVWYWGNASAKAASPGGDPGPGHASAEY